MAYIGSLVTRDDSRWKNHVATDVEPRKLNPSDLEQSAYLLEASLMRPHDSAPA